MWRLPCVVLIFSCVVITLQAITSRVEEIKLIYPKQMRSERDLSVCNDNEVCSLVHRRFWLRPVVERLCRCPTGQECAIKWSKNPDNQTMPLSNRSQMKFCKSMGGLPECTAEQHAILISMQTAPERRPGGKNKTRLPLHELATASCRCPERRYWQFHKFVEINETVTTDRIYLCSEVRKCATNEFCGNVRADYFSMYYRCSCPVGHMCLFTDRTTSNVTELLFTGLAYNATCIKN